MRNTRDLDSREKHRRGFLYSSERYFLSFKLVSFFGFPAKEFFFGMDVRGAGIRFLISKFLSNRFFWAANSEEWSFIFFSCQGYDATIDQKWTHFFVLSFLSSLGLMRAKTWNIIRANVVWKGVIASVGDDDMLWMIDVCYRFPLTFSFR